MNNNVVLKAVGLQKSYKEGGRLLHVLKDVNLEVHEGESGGNRGHIRLW